MSLEKVVKEYYKFVESTTSYRSHTHSALGLVVEAAEYADLWHKQARQHTGTGYSVAPTDSDILNELGDVCWFFFEQLTRHGYTLEDVIQANQAKLQERIHNGTLIKQDRDT